MKIANSSLMEAPDADGKREPFDLDAERLALALQATDLGFWDFDLVKLRGSFTKAPASMRLRRSELSAQML